MVENMFFVDSEHVGMARDAHFAKKSEKLAWHIYSWL